MIKKPPRFWKWAAIDVLVMLAWLAAWTAAVNSSSDSQIAYGFISLLIFIFVACPLTAMLAAYSIGIARQFGIQKSKWILSYAVISLVLHLAMAYSGGFFDNWINQYQQSRYERQNPDLVKLRYALSAGPRSNISEVRQALENGANPNSSISADAYIPLLVVAASRSDTRVIDALLTAGADPNLPSAINFQTLERPSALDVLLFSEYQGIAESLELLLLAGADPKNSMLLSGACWLGDVPLYRRARSLLAINKPDSNGNACLHLAAKSNRRDFFQTYISELADNDQAGRDRLVAELNAANHLGQYPLDIAIAQKHIELALVIARAGGTASRPAWVKGDLSDHVDKALTTELKELLLLE